MVRAGLSNGTTIEEKDAFAATMKGAWSVLEDYTHESSGLDWLAQSENAAVVVYRLPSTPPPEGRV